MWHQATIFQNRWPPFFQVVDRVELSSLTVKETIKVNKMSWFDEILKYNISHQSSKRPSCDELYTIFYTLCWKYTLWCKNATIELKGLLPNNRHNSRSWTNAGLMLDQRRRRWASIKTALVQRLVIAGNVFYDLWMASRFIPILSVPTRLVVWGPPETRIRCKNAGLMLAHRLRRLTNINQHWLNVLCLLGHHSRGINRTALFYAQSVSTASLL